jgi:hypothetical protein
MLEKFGKEIHEPKEELDLEKRIKKIYELITEIDKAGFSFLTMPVKSYIEASLDEKTGEIKPTRVDYLEKMVNRIYYGDYLELKRRRERRSTTDSSKREFYQICFEGKGYYGMNYIEFERIDAKTWRTSEIGIGYTTTCSKEPNWFLDILKDFQWHQISFNEIYGGWVRLYKAEGKVLGMDVISKRIERKHENGECRYYELEFSSKEGADKFSEFLFKKEKISSIDKNNLLKNLRIDDYLLFAWHQFYFIDPKYDIFSVLQRRYYDEHFLRRHKISYQDLKNAVEDYIESIVEKLYQLTEKIIEEAKKLKPPKYFARMDYYISYLREVRQEAISWEMIEKLLENYEVEIIKRAQMYHRKEGLYDKVKKGVRIKYEGRIGTIINLPSEHWMIVRFDDGELKSIRRRSSKIEFIE